MKPQGASIAVVTGGASGIGKACAEQLARQGDLVVVCDIDMERARQTAAAIGGEAVEMDVSDAASVGRAAADIENRVGPVTKLVANAGILQSSIALPEELEIETWDRVMDVDLRGVFLSNTVFAQAMATRGYGAIVNIASIAGMRSNPLHAYGPAKAAVIHLTKTLAADYGRSGVRINAVSPGFVLTPVLQDAIDRGLRDPALLEDESAAGRLVQPAEIAAGVAFLLSADASAITGINLPIDNGWLVTGSWRTWGGLRTSRKSAAA